MRLRRKEGKCWTSVYLAGNSWNSLCSGCCCFSGNIDWLPLPDRCASLMTYFCLRVSPHKTVSRYGSWNSSSSSMIFPASNSSCLPHIKASSLAISPPKLVPTRMAKNQLPSPCTWHRGKSNILIMPVSVKTASHTSHPSLPLSPIFFLCLES